MTRTDGTTQTYNLGSNKGAEVDLAGAEENGSLQGQPDRVEVWVTMNNGQTYKTVDVTRESPLPVMGELTKTYPLSFFTLRFLSSCR